MAEQYGESFRGVPMIYIGDKVFVGFSDKIGVQIEEKIKNCTEQCCDSPLQKVKICEQKNEEEPVKKITLWAAVSLALADAVNPCEFAVLTMVLVALLIRDPKKRRNVLLGGFAFTLAVFITYILYGVIIIQFFKFIHTSIASVSPYIRIGFAVVAVLLGLMNLMDYIRYKPGTIGTEMPMSFRPRVKHLINRITRPRGAFLIGIFVTLFLLPCTMGPYFVAGNLLSSLSLLNAIPWLLLYNLIFVLPMIAIILIVYFGYSTVENVSGWKEEHIRLLHLIAALILIIMGILMLLGYI
jgi:cytochrome c biogenesis protein CcdA